VLNQNVKKMSFWIILISSIIVLLVFLLINSAIRLSVYSKRFGIRTMQLVGATKAFIRKPYLLKAILFGAIGAGIASLAILGLLYYLNTIFPNVHFLQDTKLLLMLFSGIFITGLLITLISTYFATRKFFNLTSEELHY
jgi:cell division transport system permease protein